MSNNSDRYRILYELGLALSARTNLHELSEVVIERCREVFDAEGASLLLHDADANELYFPYVASDNPEVVERSGWPERSCARVGRFVWTMPDPTRT